MYILEGASSPVIEVPKSSQSKCDEKPTDTNNGKWNTYNINSISCYIHFIGVAEARPN